MVVELAKELDVQEQNGGRSKLLGNHIEENFRAVVFVSLGLALLALQGMQPHLEQCSAIPQEDTFACCINR